MIPVKKQAIGWVEDDGTEYEGEAHLLGVKQARIFAEKEVTKNLNGKTAVIEHLWDPRA